MHRRDRLEERLYAAMDAFTAHMKLLPRARGGAPLDPDPSTVPDDWHPRYVELRKEYDSARDALDEYLRDRLGPR